MGTLETIGGFVSGSVLLRIPPVGPLRPRLDRRVLECHERGSRTAMHELGIAQEIVERVSERAGAARVTRVVLEIGKLAAILPDAVRFCFDLCGEGTVVEGACLVIIETPGQARCRECGGDVTLDRPFGRCACGSTDLEWLGGEQLIIKEFEVA